LATKQGGKKTSPGTESKLVEKRIPDGMAGEIGIRGRKRNKCDVNKGAGMKDMD